MADLLRSEYGHQVDYSCAPANPSFALRLQSTHVVVRVAELGLGPGGACAMQKSRLFSRCLYGLFIAILVLEALESIFTHDSHRLFLGLAALVLVCGAATVLNLAIFPPIFRLLSRLTAKQRVKDSKPERDNVA